MADPGNFDVLALAQQLISLPSITPNDAGCQTIIAQHLQVLGFKIEHLRFEDVDNLWARYGDTEPLFIFAGHTDVVPPGPIEHWSYPPFFPTLTDEHLYGRGSADMKSSIAAMLSACSQFLTQHPHQHGSIGFLITSDEEGPAINGTRKVVEYLQNKGEKITWCLVGEASSEQDLGDVIKIGRRGSLNGNLTIHGKQGHIAYPQCANNPIHRGLSALQELIDAVWDQGNDQFQPTQFQISNIHAGTGADNVIPHDLNVVFNFRYCPKVTAEQLQLRVEAILNKHQLVYDLQWRHCAKPFLTEQGSLVKTTCQAIEEIAGITPALSTNGGTSDGRFIAPTGCQVIEFGPCNGSIHQIDEHIKIKDLYTLSRIYQRILELLLG